MDDYEQLLHSLVVERFRVSRAIEPGSANVPPTTWYTQPIHSRPPRSCKRHRSGAA